MITETVNERVSSRIRYVKPVRQSSVRGITAEVYQQMKEDYQVKWIGGKDDICSIGNIKPF